MPIERKEVIMCTCSVCGQSWLPKRCGSCKSPLWNGEQDKRGKRVKRAPKVHPDMEAIPEAPEIPAEVAEQFTANEAPIKTLREEHPGKCPHKKMRGELCYKCDHKFGLPKIKTGK